MNSAVLTQSNDLPMSFADFRDYLEQSLRNPFVLDLKDADLLTIIDAYNNNKRRVLSQLTTYSSLKKAIKTINQTYRVNLAPVQVTDIFWSMFTALLRQQGMKDSSICTLINQLRAILRWASKYNVTLSPSFDCFALHYPRPNAIALSADDVSRITYFDIDRYYRNRRSQFRRRMKQVRDMFVLSCNLYQRHSDMVRISKDCFERNIFRITQQKTGSVAVVDIDRFSLCPKTTYRIIEEYGGEAPFKGDLNNYNKYLKMLMRDIGFTEDIRIEERVDRMMTAHSVPKWSLIASHTARRTAITNAVLKGVSLHDIKRCSGHQSLDMVERYIKD